MGAASSSNYASFSSAPDSKYYDDYTKTSALIACNGGTCYGHGLSETVRWYGDSMGFVLADSPWFVRGGNYGGDSSAGAFNFIHGYGDPYYYYGFRSVLVNVG